MAIKSPKYYVYKGQELEQTYIQNIFWGVIVAIGVIAFLFVSIKKIEVGVYTPSNIPKPVVVAFAPVIREIEELPPPSRPKVEIKIVQTKQEKLPTTTQTAKTEEVKEVAPNIAETKPAEINPIENMPLPTTSREEEVYEFFKVEIKPQIVKAVQPEYPDLAKKAGIEGRVVVSVIVDENGNVINAEIISSTNSIFNEPALKAAYKYKFSPAMMKDKKVKVKVLIPFNFTVQK
ncbi:MAG: TonB family protein [candidate division WOR-3 bacterium]|jgi:protein TonB